VAPFKGQDEMCSETVRALATYGGTQREGHLIKFSCVTQRDGNFTRD